MIRTSLLNKILVVGSILFSVSLIIASALRQPIWLDEQYSLFFAQTYSPLKLLVHFTVDCHPGLYYLYLKSLLAFSHDLFFLRLFSSVLPALIGLASLLWFGYKEKTQKILLIIAPVLFLNPLLINVVGQLRMYGLVVMVTCIFYICWQQWLKTKKNTYLLIVFATLFVSILIYYSFLLLAGMCIIYLLWQEKSKVIKYVIAFTVLILLELAITSDLSAIEKLNFVAWIPGPNLASTASVYSTMLGFNGDYFVSHLQFNLFDILLDLILLGGIFYWLKHFKQKSIRSPFIMFGIIPIAIIFLASIALPIFSHLPFFYHFIPDVSLFIPRVQLPFLILSFLYGFNELASKISFKKLFIVLSLMSLVWLNTNYQFNFLIKNSPAVQQTTVQQLFTAHPDALFFPSWLFIEEINSQNINQASEISAKIKTSSYLEKNLDQPEKTCNFVKGKTVITDQFITENLSWEIQKININLSHCCTKVASQNGFDQWQCGQ